MEEFEGEKSKNRMKTVPFQKIKKSKNLIFG